MKNNFKKIADDKRTKRLKQNKRTEFELQQYWEGKIPSFWNEIAEELPQKMARPF